MQWLPLNLDFDPSVSATTGAESPISQPTVLFGKHGIQISSRSLLEAGARPRGVSVGKSQGYYAATVTL